MPSPEGCQESIGRVRSGGQPSAVLQFLDAASFQVSPHGEMSVRGLH